MSSIQDESINLLDDEVEVIDVIYENAPGDTEATNPLTSVIDITLECCRQEDELEGEDNSNSYNSNGRNKGNSSTEGDMEGTPGVDTPQHSQEDQDQPQVKGNFCSGNALGVEVKVGEDVAVSGMEGEENEEEGEGEIIEASVLPFQLIENHQSHVNEQHLEELNGEDGFQTDQDKVHVVMQVSDVEYDEKKQEETLTSSDSGCGSSDKNQHTQTVSDLNLNVGTGKNVAPAIIKLNIPKFPPLRLQQKCEESKPSTSKQLNIVAKISDAPDGAIEEEEDNAIIATFPAATADVNNEYCGNTSVGEMTEEDSSLEMESESDDEKFPSSVSVIHVIQVGKMDEKAGEKMHFSTQLASITSAKKSTVQETKHAQKRKLSSSSSGLSKKRNAGGGTKCTRNRKGKKDRSLIINKEGYAGKDQWIVEEVVDSRVVTDMEEKLCTEYCVKWLGYESDFNEWKPRVETFEGKIEDYWRKKLKQIQELNAPLAEVPAVVNPTTLSNYFGIFE